MWISDLSVRRPVFASVISLLMVTVGIVAYDRLPLREYPDIDPPIVSIQTAYPGASAAVVESRITELIEDRIAGIEGIRFVSSSSEDGRSRIDIEFRPGHDIDTAANDVRDRVARVSEDLPEDADPPDVGKEDSDADVIMWLNLTSDRMDTLQLTDYARRHLEDRFSVLPGVARVRLGGELEYAMRIWLDRQAMAARGVTVQDVEAALRAENVELPAGRVESSDRLFTARVKRGYHTAEDFGGLVVGRGGSGQEEGHLVRLSEVARVAREAAEDRVLFRGNGIAMLGIGIIKQSTANTIEVARAAKALKDQLNPTLPTGMRIAQSYDTSVFIEQAIREVYKTLGIAVALVVLVIYLFLGSLRATLVPAITVPVSLVATCIALLMFGFSINLLTLLALVLAVGLVVDDSIVMLENIHRRLDAGEPPLLAAYRGARQVGFAVVATSVVLIAVFLPITFLQGDIGRLFSEFALTMAGAVFFSTIVALSLSPMLCSLILKRHPRKDAESATPRWVQGYEAALRWSLNHFWAVVLVMISIVAGMAQLYRTVPVEYAPQEDRGVFFVLVNGPEGATFDYMVDYVNEVERRMMPLVESGEAIRLLVRAPRSRGGLETFNSAIVIVVLSDWSERRSAWGIMDEVRRNTGDLPGVRAFPVMRQGFGGGISKPVEFVLGGGTYEDLADWRDRINAAIARDNPGLVGPDWDYKETQPQLRIEINRDQAADLGVSVAAISGTLQTMLGTRRVTTYIDDGEEYDVILEGERDLKRTLSSVENLYVRSSSSGELIPLGSLVTIEEQAGALSLNRYNRIRAMTLDAGLADGVTLDQALAWLEAEVARSLPTDAVVDYKGQSQDLRESSESLLFIFGMALTIVFLVLAAQFESYIHPLVIMLTVPLAIAGALFGLWATGSSLNIYSQIGLVMLIGLSAKNGILIVEFANQLRDQGMTFDEALVQASVIRVRPIVMTGITTAAGALPLMLAYGAGAETRQTIGTVVMFGVLAASLFTVFVIPNAYALLARRSGSPEQVSKRLDGQAGEIPDVDAHKAAGQGSASL